MKIRLIKRSLIKVDKMCLQVDEEHVIRGLLII